MTPLMLCMQFGRQDMFETLLDNFAEHIDYAQKDAEGGNTALHLACEQENREAVTALYKLAPELCMQVNYLGRSPFFIACLRQNLEIMNVFESWKHVAVIK